MQPFIVSSPQEQPSAIYYTSMGPLRTLTTDPSVAAPRTNINGDTVLPMQGLPVGAVHPLLCTPSTSTAVPSGSPSGVGGHQPIYCQPVFAIAQLLSQPPRQDQQQGPLVFPPSSGYSQALTQAGCLPAFSAGPNGLVAVQHVQQQQQPQQAVSATGSPAPVATTSITTLNGKGLPVQVDPGQQQQQRLIRSGSASSLNCSGSVGSSAGWIAPASPFSGRVEGDNGASTSTTTLNTNGRRLSAPGLLGESSGECPGPNAENTSALPLSFPPPPLSEAAMQTASAQNSVVNTPSWRIVSDRKSSSIGPGTGNGSGANGQKISSSSPILSSPPRSRKKERPTTATVPLHGSAKLFVGQIPGNVTAEELEMVFSFYGTVTEVTIQRTEHASSPTSLDPKGRSQRGGGKGGRSGASNSSGGGASSNSKETIYAFITYASMIEADVAIAALHGRYTLSTTLSPEKGTTSRVLKDGKQLLKADGEGESFGDLQDQDGEGGATRREGGSLLSKRAMRRLQRVERRLQRADRPMQVSYARVTTNLSFYGFHHAMQLHEAESTNPKPLKPSGRPTHYSWKKTAKQTHVHV